ncbi:Myosin-11 [Trapelia coarctata]|nr:Myosin-11 [Trapelia coarctata]
MDAPPSPPDSPQSLPTSPTGVFEFPMSMAPSIVEGVATWNRDTEKIPMVEMAMRLQILKDELDRVYLEIDSFRMWQEENPSTAEEVARWTEGELKANEMYELMLRSTLEERKIRCESEIAELEKKLKESRKLAEANLELPSHDNKVLKRELESTKNKLLDEEIEERDKPVAANSKPLSYDIKVLKRIEELESIIASKDKLLKTFDSILKNDPTSATMEDDGTHPTLNLLRESKKNERDLKARVKGLEDQLDDLIVTRDDSESKIKSLSAANGKYKVETAKLDVEISALRSRVQELERSNANSLSTKLRLDGRIVELQKQVGDQNVELKEIDILLATVRKELRIANKVKTDFQSQLRECQTDKLTLKAKVALSDNIRDDLAGQKRYNAELKKRIVEFGDQIDQAMEERLDGLATYDGEVRRMQSFDLGYRDGLWGFEGGNVLKNSLSNTSVSNTSFPTQQFGLVQQVRVGMVMSYFYGVY